MRVLYAVNEAAPLYKIGGLGDVGGALPKTLSTFPGCDIRLILPFHPEIKQQSLSLMPVTSFSVIYNHEPLPVQILLTQLPSSRVPVYLVEEQKYLSTRTDASDNHADKFAVFSTSIVEWLAHHSNRYQPDIIHCQDWHTSLIPLLITHRYNQIRAKTLITIHNLEYQGSTSTPIIDKLHLDPKKCRFLDSDLSDNELNILLEGLVHTDFISTVSPTYAKEIAHLNRNDLISQTLSTRRDRLVGILNGIDTQTFNPHFDSLIYKPYSLDSVTQGKLANKSGLIHELKLQLKDSDVLIGFVGRVDPGQKGIDLLIEAIRRQLLPPVNTGFVFLGTGDPNLEKELHQVAANHPRVSITTRFDETLAHKIYAASDVLLIPSHYEPCGLIQLIAMRYGSLPVAHATGGLIDTIKPKVTGWLYTPNTVEGMMGALNGALESISHLETLHTMQESAMKQDFTWNKPAKEYLKLYRNISDS